MSYVTSVERIGFKRGLEQGEKRGLEQGEKRGLERIRQSLLEGIELGLQLKFGTPGLNLLPEIRKIEDVDVLHTLLEALKTVETLDELRSLYQGVDA